MVGRCNHLSNMFFACRKTWSNHQAQWQYMHPKQWCKARWLTPGQVHNVLGLLYTAILGSQKRGGVKGAV